MRLSDFILLKEKEKRAIVLHNGVLVGKRTDDQFMVFLFQLQNYYVETYCNKQNKEIVEYRVFNNTKLLAPYLDSISISHLVNSH